MRYKTKRLLVITTVLFADILFILVPRNFESDASTSIDWGVSDDLTLENDIETSQDLIYNLSKIPRKRIFFDMSHEQFFNVWDTGFYGYSELNKLLQNYFIEVSTITRSLSDYVMNMTSEDILVLGVAKFGNYTSDEFNNITNFVENGGKLIVLIDHNTFNLSQFQNPVLEYFNITMTPYDFKDNTTYVSGPKGQVKEEWIIFNSTYFDLTNLSILYGGVLNVTGNAFAIANSSHTARIVNGTDPLYYPNQPVMAGYENGMGGKVFAASDPEWLCNFESPYGGIHYGNNSALFLKVLDWFYDANLSIEIDCGLSVTPEYTLFSCPENTNFTLNITSTKTLNISTEIFGGEIFPNIALNSIGKTSWKINVSQDGYVKLTYTNSSSNINFTKLVYFFEQVSSEKILFLQNNYSRRIDPSPDGLLGFAHGLKDTNLSVFASGQLLDFSTFKSIIIANPLEKFDNETIVELINANSTGSRIIFLNSPYSSLDGPEPWFGFTKFFGFSTYDVPINNISSIFGVNFTYYILADSELNSSGKLYYPEVLGTNQTYYNLSIYMSSIINVSDKYEEELIGYNTSWGEPRPIFASIGDIGDHDLDINDTLVMAYTNETLAAGILNYFTNEYFWTSDCFSNYFYNWIDKGFLSKKYILSSNQSNFYYNDTHFNVFTTEKIRDQDGLVVDNGTLFNVILNKGEIISNDEAPGTPGFQTSAFNGSISVNISSMDSKGLFTLSIYNSTKYKLILSIVLNFSTTTPFIEEPLVYSNGTITIQWNNDNSSTHYYVFRDYNFIDNITNLVPIATIIIPNISYTENLTDFGIYYYAVIACNSTVNTSISNCVKVDLKPLLLEISPNPNSNGQVALNWTALVGANRYYVLKSDIMITEENYNTSSVILIANTTNLYYLDESNLLQGTTYYYVIIGTNISTNSTISNCESVIINYIPQKPQFLELYILTNWKDAEIEWTSILYALNYCIYISSQKGFTPSESNFFNITNINSSFLTNLDEGIYYIKIKSIGQFGNSSYSNELTLEVVLFIPVDPDNPWPLIILLISLFSVSTITIFSYFWIYIKNQKKRMEGAEVIQSGS